MKFNKVCEAMGIHTQGMTPESNHWSGKHAYPDLSEFTPMYSLMAPGAQVFDMIKQAIVAWGSMTMPGAPVLSMITDLEDPNIDRNMSELMSDIEELSDLRRSVAQHKAETSYRAIQRDIIERYVLEVIKTKLLEGNDTLNLNVNDVHEFWFSNVIASAKRNYKRCNFGEISLPPLSKHYAHLPPVKINMMKRKVFLEQLDIAIRCSLNLLWRDISRLIDPIIKAVKGHMHHTRYTYYDIRLIGNGIQIVSYGDLRILKYNYERGGCDAS